MASKSKIEWTDSTWQPIRARWVESINGGSAARERVGWHCEHVSEGCRNCYAERMNMRLGTGLEFKPGNLRQNKVPADLFLDEKMLTQPFCWTRPRHIFVCAMTDLFGAFVPDDFIDKLFAVMARCPQHIFQTPTKRTTRMREYLAARTDSPLKNILLGASVEDQKSADARRHDLKYLASQGWNTFVSYEPALGPVDWTGWGFLRWLISGGESGPNARPSHPDWHRAARDFCQAEGRNIPYFFKQHGEWLPGEVFSETREDGVYGGFVKHQDGSKNSHRGLPDYWWIGDAFGGVISTRVGKKRAGNILDGQVWDQMPEGLSHG